MAGKNRCRLFHAWSKWGPIREREVVQVRNAVVLLQYRTCERCNAIEERRVG